MHDSLAEVLPQPLLQDKTKILSRISGPSRSAPRGVWECKEKEQRFLVSMISLSVKKGVKGPEKDSVRNLDNS